MQDWNTAQSLNTERITKSFIWLVSLLFLVCFVLFIFNIMWKGADHLTLGFIINAPEQYGRAGGIFPIIVSTLVILSTAVLAVIPTSVASAVFLSEYQWRSPVKYHLVTNALDMLASTPSIVFGLFGNAFFSVILGLGYSLLAGGLTLACMILPLTIRNLQLSVEKATLQYNKAAYALGMPRSSVILKIILPYALPGLTSGLLLGIGRALAETAALIFTSGYVMRMPNNIFDSGRSLSIHIYDLAMNIPGSEQQAFASAFVLIVLIAMINAVAKVMMRSWQKKQLGFKQVSGM